MDRSFVGLHFGQVHVQQIGVHSALVFSLLVGFGLFKVIVHVKVCVMFYSRSAKHFVHKLGEHFQNPHQHKLEWHEREQTHVSSWDIPDDSVVMRAIDVSRLQADDLIRIEESLVCVQIGPNGDHERHNHSKRHNDDQTDAIAVLFVFEFDSVEQFVGQFKEKHTEVHDPDGGVQHWKNVCAKIFILF